MMEFILDKSTKHHFNSFLLFFIIIPHFLFAQESKTVDSLIAKLSNKMPDSTKILLLDEISWQNIFVNKEKASNYALKAYQLSIHQHLYKEQALILRTLGTIHSVYGNYNTALEYYFKSLNLENNSHNKKGISSCYNNIGLVFSLKGDMKNSLDYYFKSLKISEELNNKTLIAACLVNIGEISSQLKNYQQSLKNYQKAIDIFHILHKEKELAVACGKMGSIYLKINKTDSALLWFEKALQINEKRNDKSGIAYTFTSLSLTLQKMKRLNEAITYAHKSLILFETMGMKRGIATAAQALGENYYRKKDYEKAVSFSNKAIYLATEIGNLDYIRDASEFAAKAYEKLGNYQEALRMNNLWKKTSDSIISESNTKKVTQLEMQYEFNKKQEQEKVEQQRKDFRIKTEMQKQKNIRNYLIYSFLVMVIIAFVIYRGYRIKQRDNIILAKQKKEIEIQHEEIRIKNQILEQQKEEIIAQRDEIEEKSKIIEQKNIDITDSITYASKIQAAIMPPTNVLDTIFEAHFIFYKPRDIVSGDFFWVETIDNFVYFAVADCTGHGVPGAIMSMLGVSILNEIASNRIIKMPHEILIFLRNNIKQSLHQKDAPNEQKDGMDISLCLYNIENKMLYFAGAYNSMLIVRNNEAIELKADRMPVGWYIHEKDFTLKEIQLVKGDNLYLYTDGFSSQFGGNEGDKYKTGKLKKLLTDTASIPLKKQKDKLISELASWQGFLEQVDDITIMGIKV